MSSDLKKYEDEIIKKIRRTTTHTHQQTAQRLITSQYVCAICHRACHSPIGLYAHEQADKRWLNSIQ